MTVELRGPTDSVVLTKRLWHAALLAAHGTLRWELAGTQPPADVAESANLYPDGSGSYSAECDGFVIATEDGRNFADAIELVLTDGLPKDVSLMGDETVNQLVREELSDERNRPSLRDVVKLCRSGAVTIRLSSEEE